MVSPPESEWDRISREVARKKKVFAAVSESWQGSGSFVPPFPGFKGEAFGEIRILNTERKSRHSGADSPAREGTAVTAVNSGQVVLTENLYYEGNTVIIDHGLGVYSVYCHLQKIKVKESSRVEKGALIGWVGQSGRATGPHLHFGMKVRGARVDPDQLFGLTIE
jgi:murein DD-endopeptidase MepM/ murein hydrolase activator NlpD